MSMFEIRVENNLLYPVSSLSHANIDHTLDEWIRFLSYVSPDDESFLNKLNDKSLEQLTTDEIKKYLKIKEQKTMADLFIKYKNKACTRKEHDSVYKYMKNSLEDFMKSKLTENELNESCKTLAVFRKKEILELEDYIKDKMSNYNSLTLVDAYILYEVREIRYNKKADEINNKIRNDQIERQINLKKNLVKSYGPRRK